MPFPRATTRREHVRIDTTNSASVTGMVLAAVAFLVAIPIPAQAQSFLDGGKPVSNSNAPLANDPTGGFLDGGGPLQIAPERNVVRRDRGFLDDGGTIREVPDITIGRPRRRFLEDGGAITTAPEIGFTDEREEFLEDGGSVTSRPRLLIDRNSAFAGVPRGIEASTAPRVSVRTRGSISVVTIDHRDRHTGRVDARYGGSARLGSGRAAATPDIIDIDSRRLDRRPLPAAGIEIVATGGPKIIRLSPDYNRIEAQ